MRPLSDHSPPTPLSQEQFMRLFLQSEREILRYVMAIVPNVADAREFLQETALFCHPKVGIEKGLFPPLPSFYAIDHNVFIKITQKQAAKLSLRNAR